MPTNKGVKQCIATLPQSLLLEQGQGLPHVGSQPVLATQRSSCMLLLDSPCRCLVIVEPSLNHAEGVHTQVSVIENAERVDPSLKVLQLHAHKIHLGKQKVPGCSTMNVEY